MARRRSDPRLCLYPPLWGNNSFNIGAGMARTYTAAAFVKRNMPSVSTRSSRWGKAGYPTRNRWMSLITSRISRARTFPPRYANAYVTRFLQSLGVEVTPSASMSWISLSS